MKKFLILLAATAGVFVAPTSALRAQAMTVDSFDGPVTANEIATFRTHIQTIQPNTWTMVDNMANEYAQYISGQRLKALGLVYEVTGDVAVLNRMIYFCDVLLSERNDILAAPYGQHVMWTGTITHDWIQSQTDPDATANATAGDAAGHLAYCARLIVQTPSLWNQVVPDHDVYAHGATYLQRAATFIAEADDVYSSAVFPFYLNLANANRMYWPANLPNFSGTVPWNQQAMFSWGMMNSSAAHAILGDNPTLVAQYDAILQAAYNWFFNDPATHLTFTTPQGNTAYQWGYSPSSYTSAIEDNSHGNLDVQWLYRSYAMGRWGITTAQMMPIANTFCDLMILGPRWIAGNVNGKTTGSGNSAPTTSVRDGNFFLAEFRPDKYYDMVSTSLTPGATTSSISAFSHFLWAKQKRHAAGYSVVFSPKPDATTTAQTVTLTSTQGGASIRYTTNGTTPTSTTGTLYTAPFTLSQTTTLKAVAFTGTWTSPVSTATYTVWAAQPTASPAAGTYSTAQSVTLSTATPGATIRYTLDKTTPTTTTGTLYTAPITVSASQTIRAIAYTATLSPSNIRTAAYTIGTFAAAPTFSPGGGTYTGTQSVTLASATGGATIRYTTNGSDPTVSSTLYSGPISVSTGRTLKAIAIASGMSNSSIATANYTIGATITPTLSPAGGTYAGEQTVSIASATAGATIMFTLDGTTPSRTNGYIYTGPFKVKKNQTVKVLAYADNLNDSAVATMTYSIRMAAPTFSPPSGTYTAAQTVALASATSGASIRYTTDGSTPSSSTGTLYSAPITVSATSTLKAVAYANGMTDSTVATAAYTINASSAVKLPIPAANVIASASASTHVPANTVDGSLSTRWAGNGDGVWIRHDLGATQTVSHVKLAWYSGTSRIYTFDVQVSADGTAWTTVLTNRTSSGTTTALETYDFADTTGRYVRVVGHMNTVDAYTNLTEAEIWVVPSKFTVPSANVSASAHTSTHVPANTVDGSLSTRWAGNGDGVWIRYDLGVARTVSSVKLAWYSGASRVYTFDVQVSTDGTAWTTALAGRTSSGTTTALETYDFADTAGRYVRVVGHLNTVDAYTNLTEAEVWGY